SRARPRPCGVCACDRREADGARHSWAHSVTIGGREGGAMTLESVVSETVERSGAQEVLKLRVRYAVDPAAEADAGIVDLHRAPVDTDGRVRFEGDLWLQRPVD